MPSETKSISTYWTKCTRVQTDSYRHTTERMQNSDRRVQWLKVATLHVYLSTSAITSPQANATENVNYENSLGSSHLRRSNRRKFFVSGHDSCRQKKDLKSQEKSSFGSRNALSNLLIPYHNLWDLMVRNCPDKNQCRFITLFFPEDLL